MKYLLLLLLAMVVIWALKRNRVDKPQTPPQAPTATPASNMVSCAHCGVHLPQEEAVNGQQGVYCSTEHHAAAQDRNAS